MYLPGAVLGNRVEANLFTVARKSGMQITPSVARPVLAHLLPTQAVDSLCF